MKTLKESLFDDNLVGKDLRLGDLYELSKDRYANEMTNDMAMLASRFNRQKLTAFANKTDQIVDVKNKTINYLDLVHPTLINLILLLQEAPMEWIMHKERWKLIDYFRPYFAKSFDNKGFWVSVDEYKYNDVPHYRIIISDDMKRLSSPNSLRLTYVPK